MYNWGMKKALTEMNADKKAPGKCTVNDNCRKSSSLCMLEKKKYFVNYYCSASEFHHPREVCHLHFMAILKSFYCELSAYMYTLLMKDAIPFLRQVTNVTGVTKFTG